MTNEFRVIVDVRVGEGFMAGRAKFAKNRLIGIGDAVEAGLAELTAQTEDGEIGVFDEVEVIDVEPIVQKGFSTMDMRELGGIATFSVTARDGMRAFGKMDAAAFFRAIVDWDNESTAPFENVPGVKIASATPCDA